MPVIIEESTVQSAIQAVVGQGNYLSTQTGHFDVSAGLATIGYRGAFAGTVTIFGTGTLVGRPATVAISGHIWPTLPLAISDSDRQNLRFRIMVQEWKRETGHLSSMAKTVLHPAYQAIIGMGNPALPLIFEQLQRDRDHWLWALHAITQEDPARGLVDFDEAVDAWLRWGKDHGYL